MERIYDNGHGIHNRWQGYLEGAGVLRGCWRCCNPSCGKAYGLESKLGIYPPYSDQFTQHQHQFGPYAAMEVGKKGGE